MLKKFTTLLCIGALAVAFVGCEKAETAVDDAGAAVEGAVDDTGDAIKDAAGDVKDAAKDAVDKVKSE